MCLAETCAINQVYYDGKIYRVYIGPQWSYIEMHR